MVMHKGRLLEIGPTEQIWAAPTTDYARTLLASDLRAAKPGSATTQVTV
jgi:ABC-type microcin C transport system duplicated ATPase subunit YejF